MIGKLISHYKIISKLGHGGMGEVYLAQDVDLNRKVALKFINICLSENSHAVMRLENEARITAALSSPNIVIIYEIGKFGNKRFIAMEYVEGKTLNEIITKSKLSEDDAVSIFIQLCRGLSAAHKSGIIHRDLKPENVILNNESTAKILDFGLSRQKESARLTKTGTTMGTVSYMSPEQASGEEIDHRSDIFSLGIMLYQMLSSKLPFIGKYEAAILYSIVNDEPVSLEKHCPKLNVKLIKIVERCLQKDSKLRYQSVDEILTELDGYEKLKPEFKISEPKPKPSRKQNFAIGMLFLLFLILGFSYRYHDNMNDCFRRLLRQSKSAEKETVLLLPFTTNTYENHLIYYISGISKSIKHLLESHREIITLGPLTTYKLHESFSDSNLSNTISPPSYIISINGKLIDNNYVTRVNIIGDRGEIALDKEYDLVSKSNYTNSHLKTENLTEIVMDIGNILSIDKSDSIKIEPSQISEVWGITAYGDYFAQRYQMSAKTIDYNNSKKYYSLSLERDPQFSPALSGLSWLNFLVYLNTSKDKWLFAAEQNLKDALKFNSDNFDAVRQSLAFGLAGNQALHDAKNKLSGLAKLWRKRPGNIMLNANVRDELNLGLGLYSQALEFAEYAYLADICDIDQKINYTMLKLLSGNLTSGDSPLTKTDKDQALLNPKYILFQSIFLAHQQQWLQLDSLILIAQTDPANLSSEILNIPIALQLINKGEIEQSYTYLRKWRESPNFYLAVEFMPGIWGYAGLPQRTMQIIEMAYNDYGVIGYEWYNRDPWLTTYINDPDYIRVLSKQEQIYNENLNWYHSQNFAWDENTSQF